jgi:hypothetical protein
MGCSKRSRDCSALHAWSWSVKNATDEGEKTASSWHEVLFGDKLPT